MVRLFEPHGLLDYTGQLEHYCLDKPAWRQVGKGLFDIKFSDLMASDVDVYVGIYVPLTRRERTGRTIRQCFYDKPVKHVREMLDVYGDSKVHAFLKPHYEKELEKLQAVRRARKQAPQMWKLAESIYPQNFNMGATIQRKVLGGMYTVQKLPKGKAKK